MTSAFEPAIRPPDGTVRTETPPGGTPAAPVPVSELLVHDRDQRAPGRVAGLERPAFEYQDRHHVEEIRAHMACRDAPALGSLRKFVPTASETTATAVNPGFRASIRKPWRRFQWMGRRAGRDSVPSSGGDPRNRGAPPSPPMPRTDRFEGGRRPASVLSQDIYPAKTDAGRAERQRISGGLSLRCPVPFACEP
jgi:hypothetical protein